MWLSSMYLAIKNPWSRLDPSPWPWLGSLALGCVPLSFTIWVWGGPFWTVGLSLALATVVAAVWATDFIVEGTSLGSHSSHVGGCVSQGMMLFILSEIMFFFSFFWAWAHSCMAPSGRLGAWPPTGIETISLMGLPLVNLMSLVWSSGMVNLSNGYLRAGDQSMAIYTLGMTILLGGVFLVVQFLEYSYSPFTICDNVYGSTFFLLTGFHGAHVIGGISFLIFNLFRMTRYHFHAGMNIAWVASVWYWHFVDVIWVFLWSLVYGYASL